MANGWPTISLSAGETPWHGFCLRGASTRKPSNMDRVTVSWLTNAQKKFPQLLPKSFWSFFVYSCDQLRIIRYSSWSRRMELWNSLTCPWTVTESTPVTLESRCKFCKSRGLSKRRVLLPRACGAKLCQASHLENRTKLCNAHHHTEVLKDKFNALPHRAQSIYLILLLTWGFWTKLKAHEPTWSTWPNTQVAQL